MFRWLTRAVDNINVPLKLALGFGLILLLTLAIALTGWSALGTVLFRSQTLTELGAELGFGVTTALIKTEPVTLALIGAALLAEPLGPARMAAIATATLGVVLMSGVNIQNMADVVQAHGLSIRAVDIDADRLSPLPGSLLRAQASSSARRS